MLCKWGLFGKLLHLGVLKVPLTQMLQVSIHPFNIIDVYFELCMTYMIWQHSSWVQFLLEAHSHVQDDSVSLNAPSKIFLISKLHVSASLFQNNTDMRELKVTATWMVENPLQTYGVLSNQY